MLRNVSIQDLTLNRGRQNDLVLGDIGHDILIGGGGNDLLRGEEGKDLYIINSGDGNDTIVDTASDLNGDGQPDGDGLGVVVYDAHMLQGGLKKPNESVYTSLDGQVTYQHSGSDLVVNGTLTIKNWQEGQFGIRLKDLPTVPEDPGVGDVGGGGGRTEFLKIDHYIQVGNLPDGTPILKPVYAPFFDENSNNSFFGIVPPIDDQPNTIFALGGNDFVTTGAGSDYLDGGEGDDFLNGRGGNDSLWGDFPVNADWLPEEARTTFGGNDVLAGGAGNVGNDWLYGDGPNNPGIDRNASCILARS